MCDPLTIAGVALTAGATAAQSMATSKIQHARNDALAAERIRQRGFDKEADALNARSLDRYKDFGGQQDQRGDQLGDYFANQKIEQAGANQTAADQLAATALPTSSSGLVVAEEAKQRQKASDFAETQGQALGNLRSFGDLMGDIGRKQGLDATLLNQIGGFKKGSSNVLAHELEAAQSAGAGWNTAGQIMGALGTVGTAAGLGGGWNSLSSMFGAPAGTVVSGAGIVPAAGGATYYGNPAAAARAFDLASVPGYSAYSLYR